VEECRRRIEGVGGEEKEKEEEKEGEVVPTRPDGLLEGDERNEVRGEEKGEGIFFPPVSDGFLEEMRRSLEGVRVKEAEKNGGKDRKAISLPSIGLSKEDTRDNVKGKKVEYRKNFPPLPGSLLVEDDDDEPDEMGEFDKWDKRKVAKGFQ